MNVFIPHFDGLYRRYGLVLADIGASGGVSHHWQVARRYLRVVGFEPDPREFSDLVATAKPGETYLNSALFNERKQLKLYLMRKQQVSSIFLPNRKFLNEFPDASRYDVVGETMIDADTLDHQLSVNSIAGIDFIKLDTQGSELYVLEGARDTLASSVVGVEVEVEFAELYQNQPLFGKVNDFLHMSGFWLFDIRRQFLKRSAGVALGANKGQLVFCDALYFKSPESLQRTVRSIGDADARKSKVLNALAVFMLYGYFDYAMRVLADLDMVFSDSERSLTREWVAQQGGGPSWLGKLASRPRVGAAFDIIANFLRRSREGWAFSDRKLGNKY